MATKTKSTASKAKATKRSSAKSGGAESPVDFIVRRAKSTGWMAIMESLIIGFLGILLIWNPQGIVKLIFYVVGIFLMVKGVYKILNYFAVHTKYEFYNNDLLYGVIALVFGLLVVIFWEQLNGAISLIVGMWMCYGALVRLNTSIKLHAAGVSEWFYVMLLSLVMLALGLYMIISMQVGIALAVVGWVMLASAIVGIIDDIIFMRHIDELKD